MRILVTGGAGFIGSNLVRRLMGDRHEVTVADDFSSGSWKNLADLGAEIVACELAEEAEQLTRLEPFEVIFHEAAITDTTVMDQKKMMRSNVDAFRGLLEMAVNWKSRMVWASSASIYGQGAAPMKESQKGDPLNPYAFSKMIDEPMAARFAEKLVAPAVGLRYFNVYGPGEDHKGKFASMIHQLAKQMRAGKRPRIFTDGEQKRDFVYVEDVVQANLLAMKARVGGVFNVGSGVAFSFNQVVVELNKVMGTKLAPEYFANPYSFTQDLTQADLSSSEKGIGYRPAYDPRKGIAAYAASGKLGV